MDIDYTSNKITDTYNQGLKTYREKKKLNKEISSQIHNLGFKYEFSNSIDLQFVAGEKITLKSFYIYQLKNLYNSIHLKKKNNTINYWKFLLEVLKRGED